METTSLIIGGILGFLIGLAITRPRGDVNVAIQHNITQAEPVDDEDHRENWWKRGDEPPGFSDN
jgi:hypothetical protein